MGEGRASLLIAAFTLTSAAFVITAIYYIAVGRFDCGQRERDAQVVGLELISTLAGSQHWPSVSPDRRLINRESGRHAASLSEESGWRKSHSDPVW
jgi:hypothetical protein